MSIIKWTKNNYKIINITALFLGIYVLTFPIILSILEKNIIGITKCPYLMLTGKPCPLCGGTRFIKNIGHSINDLSYFLNFFGVIIIIVVLEIVFRIINILKNEHKDNIIKLDVFVHILIFISYIIYEIWFILN